MFWKKCRRKKFLDFQLDYKGFRFIAIARQLKELKLRNRGVFVNFELFEHFEPLNGEINSTQCTESNLYIPYKVMISSRFDPNFIICEKFRYLQVVRSCYHCFKTSKTSTLERGRKTQYVPFYSFDTLLKLVVSPVLRILFV